MNEITLVNYVAMLSAKVGVLDVVKQHLDAGFSREEVMALLKGANHDKPQLIPITELWVTEYFKTIDGEIK